MIERKTRDQRLWVRVAQSGQRLLVPRFVAAIGRRFGVQLLLLLGVAESARFLQLVFDLVFGGLHDDAPLHIESAAPCPTGDLLEVAHGQIDDVFAVKLAELCEEDGANRDVDPDAEGIRPADDLQYSALREAFDEAAILGEHARVMDADAVWHEARQLFAEGAVETKTEKLGCELLLVFFRGEVQALKELKRVERFGVRGKRKWS